MYQPSSAAAVDLPASYTSLDIQHITVEHVPPSSPVPTSVILIKLNRPGKNNAFTVEMYRSLEKVYQLVDRDDRVKVIVLTGAGRMFCAGADLEIAASTSNNSNDPSMGSSLERTSEHRDTGGRVSLAMHRCSKPTIAAIQGAAVGVGITMCLPAAIRVAFSKAKIGFVFARRGIVMEGCSSYFLPRLIGRSRTLHLITTGEIYPADHALLHGLFSETLSSPEETLHRALEIADNAARNTSLISTKLMRDMVYRGPSTPEEAHLLESKILAEISGNVDQQEGGKSFLEKRPASFQGSMSTNAPPSWPWWTPVDIGHKNPNSTKL